MPALLHSEEINPVLPLSRLRPRRIARGRISRRRLPVQRWMGRLRSHRPPSWEAQAAASFGTEIAPSRQAPSILLIFAAGEWSQVLTGKAGSEVFTEEEASALGEYYNRARVYDTDRGRFTSRDKWEGNRRQPISLNKYIYCNDDPINNVDPSGLATMTTEEWSAFIRERVRINNNWDNIWRHVCIKITTICIDADRDYIDNVESVFSACHTIFSTSSSPQHHGFGIDVGVHTADGSCVTHFFAGAWWGMYVGEVGRAAQRSFENGNGVGSYVTGAFGAQAGFGGDAWSDTAYAYLGTVAIKWFQSETKAKVDKFSIGEWAFIHDIFGDSPPNNRDRNVGIQQFILPRQLHFSALNNNLNGWPMPLGQ